MERPNKSMPTLREQENSLREAIAIDKKLMFTTPPPNSKIFQPINRLNDDEGEKRDRRKTALDLKRRRTTLLPSPRKRFKEIEIEAEAPLPVLTGLSVEEINRRYEEWMKIAADNKINTTNTWNFELIDYFSKLSFFRDGNTINFQKASCTLDGCVKIYTSRVDSVVSETGILLNGLTESSAQRTKALVEEFEEGNSEKTKKKSSRSEATLAKDFSSLNVKNFDLDFSVDPLFKKTCADFDEGGARGLLLNHLITQGNGRLIFDASDALLSSDNFEDKTDLSARTCLNLNTLIDSLIENDNEEQVICPSLINFQFGTSLALDLTDLKHLQNDEPDVNGEAFDAPNDHDDFFDEPTGINGDMSFATFAQQNTNDLEATDIQEENEDLQVSLQPKIGFLAESENIFSYFDSRFIKNWSGPEHWKLKAVTKAKPVDVSSQEPKAKSEKSFFEINFLHPSSKVSIKTLFAPGEVSIENTRLLNKPEESYMHPKDHQFFSKNFLTLFHKPNLSLNSTSSKSLMASDVNSVDLGDQYDDDVPQNLDYNITEDSYEPENPTPGTLLTQSTDYQSLDNPESMFELNGSFIDKELSGLNVGDQLIPALKRIQTMRINYMKIAKRVDVKALKENLWKKLIPISDEAIEEEETSQPLIKTEPTEPLVFSSVVKSLSSVYEPKKYQELSVPFCFICLLHLANEHNLEIKDNMEMNELVINQELNQELNQDE